jgi:CheY-like chemotaxis protein
MILVVDDDISLLELASQILNRDRKVFLAIDSKQALQLVQHLGFSVALVDLDLKGQEGLSLIRRLREAFPEMPVIAISGALADSNVAQAKRLGIAEVLRKPITPEWKPVVDRFRAVK